MARALHVDPRHERPGRRRRGPVGDARRTRLLRRRGLVRVLDDNRGAITERGRRRAAVYEDSTRLQGPADSAAPVSSLVPSANHQEPDRQATWLWRSATASDSTVALAERRGVAKLWRGRTAPVGADTRWQALADAAFHLHSSTHPGLAEHVLSGLGNGTATTTTTGTSCGTASRSSSRRSSTNPTPALAMLDYRSRTAEAAREERSAQRPPWVAVSVEASRVWRGA